MAAAPSVNWNVVRVVALALALLPALGLVQPANAADPWRKLHRPLHLPRLAPGDACPVSPVDQRVDWESVNAFGDGIGPGPVYPGLGDEGHLTTEGSGPWFGTKVFWYVKPSYPRRVLIRGRRLDGPGKARFHDSGRSHGRLLPDLRITRNDSVSWEGQPRGSRGVPSGVFIRAPGCYGVQIDGTRFSRTVVFTASTP
jgi:hypothetical protein